MIPNVITLINGSDSNFADTTRTLKCVSESFGTLCINDSLTTSRCMGSSLAVIASVIAFSMGPLVFDDIFRFSCIEGT